MSTAFDKEDIEKLHNVSWNQFERGVKHLLEALHEFEDLYGQRFVNVYGIPRGGMCLATKLSYLLGRPLLMDDAQITNDTLIVDDCTNTGKTLRPFQDRKLKTLTFVHKPNVSGMTPTFYCFTTNATINFPWESKHDTN